MKKNILLGIILLITHSIYAQQFVTIDHIGLAVRNVDTSAAFYTKILGLKSIPNPWPGKRIHWFLIGNNIQLHLIEYPKDEVLPVDSSHLSFSTSSINDFIVKLKQGGITYFSGDNIMGQMTTRPDGVHQIYFKDPDGYEIEINDRLH
jgi:lactoylglutathione lyase